MCSGSWWIRADKWINWSISLIRNIKDFVLSSLIGRKQLLRWITKLMRTIGISIEIIDSYNIYIHHSLFKNAIYLYQLCILGKRHKTTIFGSISNHILLITNLKPICNAIINRLFGCIISCIQHENVEIKYICVIFFIFTTN